MLQERGALCRAPSRSSAEPSVSEGGKLGREMADRISPWTQLPCNRKGSLTCRKSAYGTHGFTSLPKEGMLRIFTPEKIRRLRPSLNPRTWVPEGSMLTTRPPKPLCPAIALITLSSGKACLKANSHILSLSPAMPSR
jgi:hypothetical protein